MNKNELRLQMENPSKRQQMHAPVLKYQRLLSLVNIWSGSQFQKEVYTL